MDGLLWPLVGGVSVRNIAAVAAFALWVSPAFAIEIYQCEPLQGKTTWVDANPIDWKDDFYGPSTVVIDDNRFVVSSSSAVPDVLKGVVDDDRTVYDLVITSRDEDHVIGIKGRPGGMNVFQFHRPTRMLINIGTRIDNFALLGSMRSGNALAFVAQCR
jgi:hypothetical protein